MKKGQTYTPVTINQVIRYLNNFPELIKVNYTDDDNVHTSNSIEFIIKGACHPIVQIDKYLDEAITNKYSDKFINTYKESIIYSYTKCDIWLAIDFHVFHDIFKDGKHWIGDEITGMPKKIKTMEMLYKYFPIALKKYKEILNQVKLEKEKLNAK